MRRQDVWAMRDRLGMFVVGGRYGALVSHLLGRRWAHSAFLDGFQAFVAADASDIWPTANALRAFKAPFRDRKDGFDVYRDHAYVRLFLPVVMASKLYVVDGTSDSASVEDVAQLRFQQHALNSE